ncbi:FtsX-like permease family protein [Reichenbachiella ulvae]|uniref:Permease prefix domain 2-containing transporter n=1 Tax=Reichenbachiella ulvae TaxID=2980104 RepID=A0ABT3CQR2_9BACT|nr:FtsX-like permease family protein [Reichenbachiella ulvae]MCV9385957.1 permease prefix domain 2-containing transporter [Reichenbachiella ulvae]
MESNTTKRFGCYMSTAPKWINSLLQKLCKPELLEEIEGDLQEYYELWTEEFGEKKANRMYIWHGLKFLRPFAIKNLNSINLYQIDMFIHYLKITFRNFSKHKSFSLINGIGLAISLACCILIGIYLKHELSYDRYLKNSDRIYRLSREFINTDGSTSIHLAHLAPPFAPYMRQDFPEMEAITQFDVFSTTLVIDGKEHWQPNIALADNYFFQVFPFEFISGDPSTALENPGSLVLTEKTAMRYFGKLDVLGESFQFGPEISLMITGVIKDMPENTHFSLEMLADFSFAELNYGGRENMMQAWAENNLSTYFLLKEGASIKEIEKRFPDFFTNHMNEKANDWTALHTQNIRDIHLYSHLDGETWTNGDIVHVYTFSAIGLLILVISIINYINLTTAMSIQRSKEVGLRKVMGAVRSGLVTQFMTESLVMVFLSIGLGFILAFFALPYLRNFTGNAYVFGTTEIIQTLGVITLAGILIGLVSGAYPAMVISKFKPIHALKSNFTGIGAVGFRRVLVIIQFSISSILILCTILVFEQLSFMNNKSLGFDKEQMLILFLNDDARHNSDAFKESLLNHSSILSYGLSNSVPSSRLTSFSGVKTEVDGDMVEPKTVIKNIRVDESFIPNYGINLVAGRNFDPDIRTDSVAFILNQAAVNMIGWTSDEDAIHKALQYGGKEGPVIGVIEDIHFESLQSKIVPMIFFIPDESLQVLSIKMEGEKLTETMNYIEDQWYEFFPDLPIDYQFLDERFRSLYETENKRAQLFTGLSLVAIFIASLGLFGLASFTVSRRTREVGIRKALGASINQVLLILSKEFLILVSISLLVGFPIAFFFSEAWLDNYAYRITIGFLPFVVTSLICLAMAFAAISFKTVRTAKDNPVKSLRYE